MYFDYPHISARISINEDTTLVHPINSIVLYNMQNGKCTLEKLLSIVIPRSKYIWCSSFPDDYEVICNHVVDWVDSIQTHLHIVPMTGQINWKSDEQNSSMVGLINGMFINNIEVVESIMKEETLLRKKQRLSNIHAFKLFNEICRVIWFQSAW